MHLLNNIHAFIKSLGLENEDIALKDIDEIIFSEFLINLNEQEKTEKIKLLDSAKDEEQIDAAMKSILDDVETKELFDEICYKVIADWWATIKPTMQTDKIQSGEEQFQDIKQEA